MKQIFLLRTAMLVVTICHPQANTKLSNLVSLTAINVNLLPGGTTGTKNFGADTKRWKNGYFNTTVFAYGIGGTYGVYAEGGNYGLYGASSNSYGVAGGSGFLGVYGSGGTYGFMGSGGSYGLY